MIIASFLALLLVFVGVGLASFKHSKPTNRDYLLAGHSVKPWLVGLSAVATNNSGYMFTGMIGFTYLTGLSSVWLMIGWIAGDFLGSLFVHRRLREVTESKGSLGFVSAVSQWTGRNYRVLRLIGAVVSVLFLGAYAAAQFTAGSKALHVIFGWDLWAGAVIGSVIVLLYCYAGGIRASIWTDAAQSVVMIFSMAVLLFVSVQGMGGVEPAVRQLSAVEPGYMNWFPSDLAVPGWKGAGLFVMGWMFAGFAVVGQPHIMIRFMALDNPVNLSRARLYYYGWFILFYAMTIGAGLMARLWIPQVSAFDAELALPKLSLMILPDVLVGLMLAGLFAATISTADSLILSCSAAITGDILSHKTVPYWMTKAVTLFVTALALGIALYGDQSVFQLVLYAWAVLGAAFAPLLIVYCLRQKPTEELSIAMMATGVAVIFLWKYLGLSGVVYELVPGILSALFVFFAGKAAGFSPSERQA